MNKISRRKFITGGVLASVGFLLLDSLWFERYIIDWNYFDISESKNNKIKLIQITDLHLESIRTSHKSIAKKINKIQPDFVVLTGDSVDATEKINLLDDFLQLIDNKIPKFAITGNWEYWGNVNLQLLNQTYQKNNCQLLINENVQLNLKEREITIIGIDDFIGGNANFKEASKNLISSETNIVLTHCPQHRDIIAKEKDVFKINLVLSGHTHGGQVNLFGFVPFTPKGSDKYLKGWYNEQNPIMYVSKGIGTSMLPIRFGARAEVVEIDI